MMPAPHPNEEPLQMHRPDVLPVIEAINIMILYEHYKMSLLLFHNAGQYHLLQLFCKSN